MDCKLKRMKVLLNRENVIEVFNIINNIDTLLLSENNNADVLQMINYIND